MLGAILALAFVAGGPAGPDPAALVEELGSPRYLQRESAEAALTRLGRAALPDAPGRARTPGTPRSGSGPRRSWTGSRGRCWSSRPRSPSTSATSRSSTPSGRSTAQAELCSQAPARGRPGLGRTPGSPSGPTSPCRSGRGSTPSARPVGSTTSSAPSSPRAVATRPSRSIRAMPRRPSRSRTAARSGPIWPASITRARSSSPGPDRRSPRGRIGRRSADDAGRPSVGRDPPVLPPVPAGRRAPALDHPERGAPDHRGDRRRGQVAPDPRDPGDPPAVLGLFRDEPVVPRSGSGSTWPIPRPRAAGSSGSRA